MGAGKKEEIRAALGGISQEILADSLALLLSEGKAPEQPIAGMNKPEWTNFAQAVLYLKKNYQFDELDYFTTEADLVYVNAGDRKILLTDRMNLPADKGNAGYSAREAASGKTPGVSSVDAPAEEPSPFEPSGGRFSNLEI